MTDLQYLIYSPVQKIAVMSNHKKGFLHIFQVFLQPGCHLHVQMIRGLIQKKHIKLLRKYPCHGRFSFLTSGERRQRDIQVCKPQNIQITLNLPVCLRLSPQSIGCQRPSLRKLRTLRQPQDFQAVLPNYLSCIRYFFSGYDP